MTNPTRKAATMAAGYHYDTTFVRSASRIQSCELTEIFERHVEKLGPRGEVEDSER